MEDYCKCDNYEEKGISPEEIFKNFIQISYSEAHKGKYSNCMEFTSLLKCSKCNSYYLMNRSNSLDKEKSVIFIKRYYPKVDEPILIKTLKSLEGVITKKELDECSELSLTVTNMLNRKKIQNAGLN